MPQAKLELFEEDLQGQAALFKALGHPARLAILNFLSAANACYTGDISSELPLARTTVTQHLAELLKAGLIQGSIGSTKTNYCLNPDGLEKLRMAMEHILRELDCCRPIKCD